jgi:hypothetical protein
MPGTFSQTYMQIVFAVKGRENLIAHSWKSRSNYITPLGLSGNEAGTQTSIFEPKLLFSLK